MGRLLLLSSFILTKLFNELQSRRLILFCNVGQFFEMVIDTELIIHQRMSLRIKVCRSHDNANRNRLSLVALAIRGNQSSGHLIPNLQIMSDKIPVPRRSDRSAFLISITGFQRHSLPLRSIH